MDDIAQAPKWAIEEYPGAEKDFADWLEGAIYNSMIDVPPEDQESAYRLMARVRARVIERTWELEGLMGRSRAYQMWKAQKEGWYHFLPGEYDTLREFMHSVADDETSGDSTKSDLLFMADTLLPALESMGVEAEKVMSLPAHFSKARAAIPYLRDALDNQTGDQLAETVHDILEGVGDDKQSLRDYRDSLAKKAGKIQNIWGDVYVFPAYNMLVIRTEGEYFQKYVERRTRGVIEFRGPKDPIELLKEITDLFTGESDDS